MVKVERLREEAVGRLKERVRERDGLEKKVEREVQEMEKTREIERKVWLRRMGQGQGGGTGAGPSVGGLGIAGMSNAGGGGGGSGSGTGHGEGGKG